MTEQQQYRVIADRDKGDDPQWADIKTHDRITYEYTNGGPARLDQVVRIERPVPTSDEPVMLTYEGCKTYPLGTVAADAIGYWAAHHRHYVKTSENTWASFWQTPTADQIAEAVKEERNNLSPCPSGYLAWVTTPPSNEQGSSHPSPHPPTREQVESTIDGAIGKWWDDGALLATLRPAVLNAVLALLQKGADR